MKSSNCERDTRRVVPTMPLMCCSSRTSNGMEEIKGRTEARQPTMKMLMKEEKRKT